MKRIKTIEQIRFCELWDRLKNRHPKAKHKDIAHVTGLTGSQVSQILKGKRGTRPNNVTALRDYVDKMCGKEEAGNYQLHDAPPQNEPTDWRQLAENLQKEIADLRSALRDLSAVEVNSSRARTAGSDQKKIPMGKVGERIDRAAEITGKGSE